MAINPQQDPDDERPPSEQNSPQGSMEGFEVGLAMGPNDGDFDQDRLNLAKTLGLPKKDGVDFRADSSTEWPRRGQG